MTTFSGQPGQPGEAQAAPAGTRESEPPAEAADRPAVRNGTETGPPASPSVAELEERWQRALADADNVRKRLERQLADQVRAERARTVAALLPVLDNLELALRHAGADPDSIIAGVQAVHEQGLAALRQLGYQPSGQVGERFDPARHEAARVVEPGDAAPGTVTAVLRTGYVDAQGRLVRPAAVEVAGERGSG